MILIYAEKASEGAKIAAALDKITLDDGTVVPFNKLLSMEKQVSSFQRKYGFFEINYKGKECIVTWGYGHLCSLKREKDYNPSFSNWKNIPLPFFPPMDIKFKDDVKPSMKNLVNRQISLCKKYFPKAEYIINATDDDREGEVIFAFLYEILKCTAPVKRTFLSSSTKKGYVNAFDNLVDSSTRVNIVSAGKARSQSDFLVGTNLTVALTLKNPNCGILSCGRLQTTMLNMIVERDLSIKNFEPEEYFTIEAEFTTNSGEKYKGTLEKDRITSKEEADTIYNSIIKGSVSTISSVEKKTKKVSCPELYSLSALQMDCNSYYKLSLKETLDIAQWLYDNEYTTYPRTKSRYLNEDKKNDVLTLINLLEKASPEYKKLLEGAPRTFLHPENHFDDSKVVSHFAIIPTGKSPAGLTGNKAKVYDLIARSIIKTVMGDAEIANSTMKTETNGLTFLTRGRSIIEKGWMAADRPGKEKLLPNVKKDEQVSLSDKELCSKFTQPPKKYTDGTFIEALNTCGKTLSDEELKAILANPEHAGIGTEATRTSAVETLISRGFITRDEKKSTYSATEKGIQLISIIPIEEIKSPEMTALWEKRLMKIEKGQDTLNAFISDVKNDVVKWLETIESSTLSLSSSLADKKEVETVGICPKCGKDVVTTSFGFGCSGYKEGCKFSIGKICEKKISKSNVKNLLKTKKSGLITGMISKKGTKFDAFLVIDDEGNVKLSFK